MIDDFKAVNLSQEATIDKNSSHQERTRSRHNQLFLWFVQMLNGNNLMTAPSNLHEADYVVCHIFQADLYFPRPYRQKWLISEYRDIKSKYDKYFVGKVVSFGGLKMIYVFFLNIFECSSEK